MEHPTLCQLRTRIFSGEVLLDEVDTIFGFRTAEFDAERGFLFNGIPTKIKGMCIHEDHGGLGTALPDNIKEYRGTAPQRYGMQWISVLA